MNAIFASKLYKASANKDKIKAALNDPINVELVEQLRSYLDDDYQTPTGDDTESEITEEVVEDTNEADESDTHQSSSDVRHDGASHSKNDYSLTKMLKEDVVDDDSHSELEDQSDTEVDDDSLDTSDTEVKESTQLDNKSAVVNSCMSVSSIASQKDSIKGLLNTRSDTSGVARINIKDNELWIHYNDNINLNNIMEPVISILNEADYADLQFNRLARTENAIVFTISEIPQPKVGLSSDE